MKPNRTQELDHPDDFDDFRDEIFLLTADLNLEIFSSSWTIKKIVCSNLKGVLRDINIS